MMPISELQSRVTNKKIGHSLSERIERTNCLFITRFYKSSHFLAGHLYQQYTIEVRVFENPITIYNSLEKPNTIYCTINSNNLLAPINLLPQQFIGPIYCIVSSLIHKTGNVNSRHTRQACLPVFAIFLTFSIEFYRPSFFKIPLALYL